MHSSDWSSDVALPISPTPLVVAQSLNDVVRHARVALVWIIVQAAAILDHEQPAFGRQPAAPLRAALVGDDNFASPDQRCVVIIPRELHEIGVGRSEEHTSELQSLMRISYAVFCLKKKTAKKKSSQTTSELHT